MEYSKLWLDYKRGECSGFDRIYYNSDDRCVVSAARELQSAIGEMSGIYPELAERRELTDENGIWLLCGKNDGKYYDLNMQSYKIEEKDGSIIVASYGAAGVLYGAFALIRKMRLGETELTEEKTPSNPLRMLNHWDNPDGSIERGYSGNSFFFKDGEIIINERTRDYARLIASVGINAVVINNVNVKDEALYFITDRYFGKIRGIADIFADYGIRLFLSANYASPIDIGPLDTADPCDERVREWWRNKAAEIYRALPDLGGFLIKADSEGRPGPFTYGRSQDAGANMLADALEEFGGIVIWRCFVYNCRQDWRDRKTDRAQACYDNFINSDAHFAPNVILQIKNGPVDFQVREPVNPLIGAMSFTNQMMEFQIAQEYTGQQRDLCYLIPYFKEILDFKMCRHPDCDTVADYVSGKAFGNRLCGVCAVTNTGNDYNWTGHDLAAANLYGFGRLAFDNDLSAEKIAGEWIEQTYGGNTLVMEIVSDMLMRSHAVYEKYTAPLGVGWMIEPADHYGPNPDGFEYSRWGTYHYADREGVGVDRTIAGTGYANQYAKPLAQMYGNVDSCPDNLLLFFHHLPYSHVLKNGKTMIQHIYDTHFEGVKDVREFIRLWRKLESVIDDGVYRRVKERLLMQLDNSVEWCDIINSYFYRKSGAKDEKGRRIY